MPRFSDMAHVTRRQIRSFDPEAKQLVEAFHDAGWRSYLSQNGHAIMYAPDGETTASVSGHSGGPHLSRTARADLERWLRARGHDTSRTGYPDGLRRNSKHKSLKRTLPKRQTSTTHEPEHVNRQEQRMTTTTDTYDCTETGCDRKFGTAGALVLHRQRTHDGMKCPECGEKFMGGGNAKKYNAHRLDKHGVEPVVKPHIRKVDGVYPCPWNCTAKFGTRAGLGGHMKVHKGQPLPEKGTNGKPKAKVVERAKVAPDMVAERGAQGVRVVPVAPAQKAAPAAPEAAVVSPSSKPEPTPSAVVSTTPATSEVTPLVSAELDAWVAGQDAGQLLANVLAILAPPLVGQIERLRRERDTLTAEVEGLKREKEEYDARMALLREAFDA